MSTIFNFIKNIFALPLGYILGFFYDFTGSYILSIILLTLLVKLCLLPISINQQKNTVARAKRNLEINKIKQKYATDQEKMQKEVSKIYAKDKTGKPGMGCLTFIIQLLVMFGIFQVVYTPLTNILRYSASTIEGMKSVMYKVVEAVGDSSTIEITLLKEADNYKDALISNGILTEKNFTELSTLQNKFTFMGLDLSLTPKFTQINALWLIPLLVLTIGIISALYSLIKEKRANPTAKKYTATDSIMFITPMLSFLFTFMFPAGVGLYWAISNLLSFIQQIILNTIYNPNKIINNPSTKETKIQTEEQIEKPIESHERGKTNG